VSPTYATSPKFFHFSISRIFRSRFALTPTSRLRCRPCEVLVMLRGTHPYINSVDILFWTSGDRGPSASWFESRRFATVVKAGVITHSG